MRYLSTLRDSLIINSRKDKRTEKKKRKKNLVSNMHAMLPRVKTMLTEMFHFRQVSVLYRRCKSSKKIAYQIVSFRTWVLSNETIALNDEDLARISKIGTWS